MAREGCLGQKRKTKNKVQLPTKGSDESDEDYNVDEDEEFNESEDESSFAEDESEEILGLDEEEDEWFEKKVKKSGKIGWPRGRKVSPTRKKNGGGGGVKQRKKQVVFSTEEDSDDQYSYGVKQRNKNTVSYKEEEDDELEVLHSLAKDEDFDGKLRTKTRNPRKENFEASHSENLEKDHVSYQEKDDGDYDNSLEDDDEVFTSGEVLKETTRNPVKKRLLRRKNKLNILKKCRDETLISQKKISNKGWVWGRKKQRKLNLKSDTDFVSSGSSDFEYTVSDEEREQVREAAEFCSRLTTRPRSLRSLKNRKKEEILPSRGKRMVKKGKQKEVETKNEVGTQVCGICLSKEGKRTVRGVLNCCSHYFCFACIMEWSKVESRCPLCKQRFATISRTARGEGGRDLHDAIFPVPECDQVYQPTEEELRGYLDPYENVLCTECLQGGDDALMLLCDLCDSPAHTYCVGLGREVPEGNWYCDGCRPTALASSNAQALDPLPDHGGSNNLSAASPPAIAVRETFDLNEVYVPNTPLTQEYGQLQSPRHSVGGHFQINSPLPGSGAFTLFDRRRIQRQIQQFLMHRHPDRSAAAVPVPTINLFGSPIFPARAGPPPTIYLRERLPDYNTPSSVSSPRISRFVGEPLSNQASTSTDHYSGGLLLSEFSGINARIGGGGLGLGLGLGLDHSQLHPCSGGASNTRPTSTTSSYQFREATVPSRTPQFNR